MTKRKPVLVLFIIAAIFYVAAAALLLLASFGVLKGGTVPAFADLNKGILGLFQGEKMLTYIISVAVPAVLFILIPLIVHLVRKQASVTVVLFLGAAVALYIELLYAVYFNTLDLESLLKEFNFQKLIETLSLFVLIGVGALLVGGILEFITFIVDMCIRVKKQPQAVPTAQAMREEPKAEEPAPAPAPAEEVKAEEPAPAEEPEPEPEKVEEHAPEEEPVPEEEEEEEEPEEEKEVEEEKPAPAPKKAPAKKPAPKKEEKKPEPKKEPAKKAPAKKEEPKKAESKKAPAKKPEPKKEEKKPAPRETTTIKKPAARETQTIKKPEVLTNEEGKSFVKAYHVSQRKELKKWQVKGAGSDKAIKLFDTQKEAIEYANQLSANNGAAVRVHSRAGKMRKA